MTFKCHASSEENKSTQNQTGLRKTKLEFSTFLKGQNFPSQRSMREKKCPQKIGRENTLSKKNETSFKTAILVSKKQARQSLLKRQS